VRARALRRTIPLVLLAPLTLSCGEDVAEFSRPSPRVDLIDDAIEAVEQHYGAAQEYFEISVDRRRVSVIVAVDGATAAEQGYLDAFDGFTPPEPVGPATGSTFTADAIEFDRDHIFDRLREELEDPTIIDFAIQGGPDGAVVYDASVASESGGMLLVLLSADGTVLGAQAA
jgi:hypothetical protein